MRKKATYESTLFALIFLKSMLQGPLRQRQSPVSVLNDEMVGLYESGLSLAEVGDRVGTSPGTVHRHLLISGVQMRDSHGRKR